MGMIADLFVKLGLKSDDFNKGIDAAKNKTSAFGSAMGKIGGMIAGAFAVGSIIEFGRTSLSEFNKAEQGATRLLTALKGNINARDVLISQAEALQKTTLFEDDETIAAQAAMAVMVKEAETIKQLMPLVQDLATAKNIDLVSASTMVGKAVMGSAGALQKMGIEVGGTAGSADRLKSVIQALNTAVGGQAEAAAKVGTGALTQLANAYGNLKEIIGGLIVQSTLANGSLAQTSTGLIDAITQKLARVKGIMAATGQGFLMSLGMNIFSSKESVDDLLKSLTELEQSKAIKSTTDKTYDYAAAAAAQEAADKRAADEKANLIDRLILQRIEEQKIIDLTGGKIAGTLQGARGGGLLPVPETKLAGLGGLNKAKESEAQAAKLINDQRLIDEQEYQDELNNIISQGMDNAVQTMFSGLADLAFGNITGGEFGNQVLAMVGNFMVQLGMLMVTTSTIFAQWKMSLATGGWGSIGLGVALIAAGAAVSSFAKKGLSGNSGYSSSSPASGYSGMQGQSTATQLMQGSVVFEIQGNKLQGVLNNQDRRNKNFK